MRRGRGVSKETEGDGDDGRGDARGGNEDRHHHQGEGILDDAVPEDGGPVGRGLARAGRDYRLALILHRG